MSIDAGRLRHRVSFEQMVVDLDSDGATVETWVDVFGQPLSAEIVPLSGRELMAAQAVQSEVNTRIRLRHRPGLVAAMRAVHRGTVYNIQAVVPDPGSGTGWVTLMCVSGVNQG
jgi:SPP1 family predicted phage head-tail adaptor